MPHPETADPGRRVCCFCPQFPDLVLSDRPWTWVALIGVESEPPVREWPFVQFRNKDATGFYNTRGIPEILKVDQKEASTYRTTRAIAIDFAGKPFLSGHKRSTPFRSLTNMGQLAPVIDSMTQTLGPESEDNTQRSTLNSQRSRAERSR